MYSLLRFLWKCCAGGQSCEAETGDEIPIRNNSFDGRSLLTSNSALTVSKIFESSIHRRPSSSTSPWSSLQPHKSSSSTGTAGPKPPTQSAVRTRASFPVFHNPSTSTVSSESSTSGVKHETSFKASVKVALSLNLTRTLAAPSKLANQLGKGMSVQVEKGKTNVSAITKVNEDLIKKENVSLSSSTSKLPQTQSVVRPTASSLVFHKLPTSTKSTLQDLPFSELSISAPKPATSSKPSLEATLLLNPTLTPAAPPNVANQQGKGMYVQVEKGKTHVCAVPKANEDLIKKENVPLSPSTSKLPTQAALKPPASSTKSSLLPYSESSTSTPNPTTSSKASAEVALSLNPTRLTPAGQSNVMNQQGKAMYIWVEEGKTHTRAMPKANEDPIKKETVPLSPSTSKLPPPFPKATTSSPKHASASDKAASSILGSPPLSRKPPPSSTRERNASSSKPDNRKNKNASSSRPGNQKEENESSSKPGNQKKDNESSSKQNNQQGKAKTPVYSIPEAIEYMFENDKVPDILFEPLSSSTYKDYFAALLYAEDYYIQKWNGFTLVNVSLELQKPEIVKRSRKDNHSHQNHKKENKIFVAIEISSVPERRPFLLSRDFVFARPSGEQREFKGIVNGVKKSNLVLVEFGEDFHSQHHSLRRYDVRFSFNRFCLKRAHHAIAIAAASDLLFQSFIFPDYISRENTPTWPANWCSHELSAEQKSAVHHILSSGGAPPYLVEGPLCASRRASYDSNPNEQLSETGVIVKEAVVQILRSSSTRRVLICARINRTCDVLIRSLKNEIPDSVMFRANAAFREIDEVPIDILDVSHYVGECFTCPSLKELKKYRVILSTFVSSFQLHNEGIPAGHFSHIFLVDASSVSEPETMVALSNFATENTTVVVTGAPGRSPDRIRSDIAQEHGLMLSYFQRLAESKQYINLDPMFITKLVC